MLNALDGFLTFIFGTLPIIVCWAGVVGFGVLGIVMLFRSGEGYSVFNMACGCIMMSGLMYAYVPIRNSIIASSEKSIEANPDSIGHKTYDVKTDSYIENTKDQNRVMNNMMALLIWLVPAVICLVMVSFHIPAVILAPIVWGFILKGF